MKDFHNISHIMINQNPEKPNANIYIYFIWCNVKLYFKKYHKLLKNVNIYILKWLKWFLIFIKFVVSTKHCDFIWLKKVCEPCEKFDNYYITNGFFSRWWP